MVHVPPVLAIRRTEARFGDPGAKSLLNTVERLKTSWFSRRTSIKFGFERRRQGETFMAIRMFAWIDHV
jgi:hypothetical protein